MAQDTSQMMNMARQMKGKGAQPQPQEQQGQEQEQGEVVDIPYLMKLEQETIEDYQKFLDTSNDEGAKQVITQILRDEQEHYQMLQSLTGEEEQGQQEQQQAPQESEQNTQEGAY